MENIFISILIGFISLLSIYLIFFRKRKSYLDKDESESILIEEDERFYPELSTPRKEASDYDAKVDESKDQPVKQKLPDERLNYPYDYISTEKIKEILLAEAKKNLDPTNKFRQILSMALLLGCFTLIVIFKDENVITNLCTGTIGIIVGYWFKK